MTEGTLSKKCLNLWSAVHWSWVAISTVLGALPLIANRINGVCKPNLLLIPAIIFVIGMLIYLYIVAYWKKFRFSYDEREIRVFSGVWWHKQTLVPYSRITNIDIMQGPWQRARNLATLKVQTAGQGANSGAEMQIFSQEDFNQLRDTFLMHINSARKSVATPDTAKDNFPEGTADKLDQIIQLLEKINKNTSR